MRKMLCGLGVAALAATAVLMFPTPAAAANSKPCWAHADVEEEQYVPVWATGGGHENHSYDFPLGETDTRAACEELFYSLS